MLPEAPARRQVAVSEQRLRWRVDLIARSMPARAMCRERCVGRERNSEHCGEYAADRRGAQRIIQRRMQQHQPANKEE